MTHYRVQMTADKLLEAVAPLVADLGSGLPAEELYRRLLQSLRLLLPCDAAALLRLEDGSLLPLAVDGLSRDTLGRRFRIAEHPRFAALLDRPGSRSIGPHPLKGFAEPLELFAWDAA